MSIFRPPLALSIIVLAMFFSWGAWGIVFNKVSPIASRDIALPLMYATGFLTIMLTILTFSLLLKMAFYRHRPFARCVHSSVRQGVFFAAAFVLIFFFQQFRVLNSWVALLIFSMTLLLEAFFWREEE